MNYSIIIPIYKEEKNISEVIKRVNKALNKRKIKYELIFVDDDSRDNSAEVFKKHKKKNMKFFKRFEKPRDLSRSVYYGFNKAKYNNFIVMDGDLQHNPKDILKLTYIFEKKNCDIVFGSRNLKSYKAVNLNPIRFYFSKILNLIFNFLFNTDFNDPMSGFFIIKKKVFLQSKKKLLLMGYKILIDIILSAPKKLKIEEIIINFNMRNQGFSKMRFKILLQLILFLIIKYLKYEKIKK